MLAAASTIDSTSSVRVTSPATASALWPRATIASATDCAGGVDVTDHHRRTLVGEPVRDRRAESRRAAGDQRDPAGQHLLTGPPALGAFGAGPRGPRFAARRCTCPWRGRSPQRSQSTVGGEDRPAEVRREVRRRTTRSRRRPQRGRADAAGCSASTAPPTAPRRSVLSRTLRKRGVSIEPARSRWRAQSARTRPRSAVSASRGRPSPRRTPRSPRTR